MSHKCILDSVTKVVVNVIELEDGANWSPSNGTEFAPQHNGNIGEIWDGEKFIKPVIEEDIQPPQEGQ